MNESTPVAVSGMSPVQDVSYVTGLYPARHPLPGSNHPVIERVTRLEKQEAALLGARFGAFFAAKRRQTPAKQTGQSGTLTYATNP